MIKGNAIQRGTITGEQLADSSVSLSKLSPDLRRFIKSQKAADYRLSGYSNGELIFREDIDLTFVREIQDDVLLTDLSPHIETNKICYVLYKNIGNDVIMISVDENSESLVFTKKEVQLNPGEYLQVHAKGFGLLRYITIS